VRRVIVLSVILLSVGLAELQSLANQKRGSSGDQTSAEIIALERAALDRWIKLDPEGYLDLYAEEITYFDPKTEGRVDGKEALRKLFAPMKSMKIPFKDIRYEIINPRVERAGDIALFTFNVTNYGKMADRPESVLSRWNSTEVYKRNGGTWKLIHSHWSLVKPETKMPNSQL
jgi:uncharacterized protein (TIGR02246 family)